MRKENFSRPFDMKNYFQKFGHTCELNEDVEDTQTDARWWSQTFVEWMTVNPTSNLTLQHFNSHSAVVRERKFHLMNHPTTIHPFSHFKAAWDCFRVLGLLSGLIYEPLQYLDYVDNNDYSDVVNLSVILCVKFFCIVDMLLRFFMGHLEGHNFAVS